VLKVLLPDLSEKLSRILSKYLVYQGLYKRRRGDEEIYVQFLPQSTGD
jgi:hypothetical protein